MVTVAAAIGATYSRAKYMCAYFKDGSMQAKVSIFYSGKLIGVGATSEERCKTDLLHTIEVLKEKGFLSEHTPRLETRNVVATVDLEKPIDMEKLFAESLDYIYEPEQFPAAIVRVDDLHVTVLVYGAGKLVIAGLRTTRNLQKTALDITQKLGLV